MTIHSALAAQHSIALAKAAGDIPNILAGDFNIKPSDYMYDLLTTGVLDTSHPAVPKARSWDSWLPTLAYAMRSAYAEVHHREPEFTNFAWPRNQAQPFIGTLDYIFVSPTCRVASVDALPALDGFDGPMPTVDEPSDHLMLAADIGIPA
jgi:endonuclease/exonuclease/phosphatase family metal-dependent hydrolase